MRLALLLLVFVFLAEHEELLKALNRALKIALLLINETNFLVALSLLVDVSSLLRNVNALVVELEGHLVLALSLVLLGDLLIHTYQILENFNFNSFKVAFSCLSESSFKLTHSFKFVLDVLFAVSKTLVGQGLTLEVLEIQRHVKAALVEVRSSAVVQLLLVAVSNALVNAEAAAELAFTPVHLGADEVVSDHFEVSFELFLIGLRSTGLYHLELLHVGFGGLNESRSGLFSQIKEVNVGLHITFTQQPHSQSGLVNLFIQREALRLVSEPLTVLASPLLRLAVLLLLSTLGDALFDLLFSLCHENFLLFLLRTLLIILHSGMRIDDRVQFHFFFFKYKLYQFK